MNNNEQQLSIVPKDDIPVAIRDKSSNSNGHNTKLMIILLGGTLGIGSIALIIFLVLSLSPKTNIAKVTNPNPNTTVTPSPNPNPTDTILGHFPYQEVAESELTSITNDGRIRLHKTAAKQYQSMITAARKQGINIVPISGFRSISQQKQLFFDVKAKRGQTAEERALVSAPPGHSEHHTGYAVDVGDDNAPSANLNTNFENTRAFQWLKNNAAFYSFEMSFPKNNRQGVSYEPWHWRYVGDQKSLETFYKAKSFYPSTTVQKN